MRSSALRSSTPTPIATVIEPMRREFINMAKLFTTLMLLLCVLPLAAQTESLLIGPGDMLHVQFYDTPELDQHVRVDDAGNTPLLFLGHVALVGTTTDQAATAIRALMVAKDFMRHPQVAVTIDQYATQQVSILGEVNKAGNYPIATSRSVLHVLSMAGGLNALADRHIVIQHRGLAPSQT